jgi:hypothetical protein
LGEISGSQEVRVEARVRLQEVWWDGVEDRVATATETVALGPYGYHRQRADEHQTTAAVE